MLVEFKEIAPNTWSWESTDGFKWDVILNEGVQPLEVIPNIKGNLKAVIKLKEAGFTAEEIIEMSNAEVL